MHDDFDMPASGSPRIDSRVLRHMMHETIDLLDLSSEHAEEACRSTDAAMALTRIDWMLMAVFNWLTRQLRTDGTEDDRQQLGEPVSVVGIEQASLSEGLQSYAKSVDRLHQRIKQLDSLIAATVRTTVVLEAQRSSGLVLNIFGDPQPSHAGQNPVIADRLRLKSALGGN